MSLPPLWHHQQEALIRMKSATEYALFFDMGTGKSRTAIEYLRHVYNKHGKVLRTLIVGPVAVLFNWRNEIAKFSKIPESKVLVLTGSIQNRVKILKNAPNDSIFITNYESFQLAHVKEILCLKPPEVMILDESQRIKSHKAIRTRNLIKISQVMDLNPVHYRLILTGTPVLNNEMDLFTQFMFLDGGKRFGKSFFEFRARFFEDSNKHMPRNIHFPKWKIKSFAREELKKKVAEISSTADKRDCMDLPPLLKTEVFLQMSPEQEKAYQTMKREFMYVTQDKASVAQIALTKFLRMQQILSGFLTMEDGTNHVFKQNPKLYALEDLLVDNEREKIIVWSVFKHDHEKIKDLCTSLKIRFAELTGDTKNKQEQIDSFQKDPKIQVMIASQAAGGVGVNLTAASIMIYFSRSYSLEQDMQSEARCYRGGSERHKRITRLDLVFEKTIERDILNALRDKKELSLDMISLAKLATS